MTLGQNICRLRTERGLSQGDLADALGVSRQSVSKWETDASVPELDKLRRLSEVFQVRLDELVNGPEDTQSAPLPPPPAGDAPRPDTAANDFRPLERQMRRIVGGLLLGLGVLLTILLAVLGYGAAGLLLSLPLFLCGVICLVAKRRAGLWCAWACALLGLVWLRATTGISWTGIFRAPSTVFRGDVAQVVSRVIAAALLLLLFGTVRSFRTQVLPWEKQNIGKVAGLWALFLGGRWAVNRFLFLPWLQRIYQPGQIDNQAAAAYNIVDILWEIILLMLLALLLVKTAALLRGRKHQRAASSAAK